MKKKSKALLGAVGFGLLTACEVPVMLEAQKAGGEMTGMFEVTLPAVTLVRLETGEEDYLSGKLVGHISGKAAIHLVGKKTGVCKGNTNSKGKGILVCANGLMLPMNGDTSEGSKMSGVEPLEGVIDTTKIANFGFRKKPDNPEIVRFVSAFGWGQMANDASVRKAVDASAESYFE